VAQQLNSYGYDAAALEAGFDAWREAGYPLESKSSKRDAA